MGIFAVAIDPESIKAIGEATAAAGGKAAELAPTNWIQALVSILGFGVFAAVVWIFVKDRQGDRVERQEAHRQCHANNERMAGIMQTSTNKCAEAATACAVALSRVHP